MTDVMGLGTGTGDRQPFVVRISKTRYSLVDESDVLHRQVRTLQADSAEFRRRTLMGDLEARQQVAARLDGSTILSELSDVGFSWRDIARLAQVTVPAVQKWRRGEGMSGAKRLRLAKVVALLAVLEERFIAEPTSWLEMPVRDGVGLSRIDLLAEGRFDLVLLLVSDDGNDIEVGHILDEFDADWRNRYVDDSFETFLDADGVVAIRPRS
ncbi:hypothetical protein [Agromyces neolithicus]|uniref:Hypoxia/intracellular survival transcriptional regulator MosR n=1 Tax=Agromyces neolithicus TaxID=269420 RepID=A0ABN2M1V0_9MICO